jgi:predicted phage gp36 major capsid-like protein
MKEEEERRKKEEERRKKKEERRKKKEGSGRDETYRTCEYCSESQFYTSSFDCQLHVFA